METALYFYNPAIIVLNVFFISKWKTEVLLLLPNCNVKCKIVKEIHCLDHYEAYKEPLWTSLGFTGIEYSDHIDILKY